MYTDYFGLKEAPFSIAPDPRYLYMSERHREALAHLLYGLKYDGGFVLLTGEVGTGKTTVCRCLLGQIPEDTDVALILNPSVSSVELLAAICDEFRIERPQSASIKELVDCLNNYLLDRNSQGRKSVLVIDEAQNLSCKVLEQIRLLTNLETNTRKLLQIVMIGQPELLEKLALPEMRQLTQRITARYHLGPLSKGELIRYVKHRLAIAGMRDELFTPKVAARLYRLSGGIPRIINVICDRALLGAYSENSRRISPAILERAAREVRGSRAESRRIKLEEDRYRLLLWTVLPTTVVAILAVVGSWYFFPDNRLRRFVLPVAEDTAAIRIPAPEQMEETESAIPGNAFISPISGMENSPVIPTDPAPPGSNDEAGELSETVMEYTRWPETVPPRGDERQAFLPLFERWQVTYPGADNSPCRYAKEVGLRCFTAKGTLEEIFAIDRPAVLQLVAANGEAFFAALLSFDGATARLVAGDMDWQASYEDVSLHWFGKYTLLWKPPPGYNFSIWADDKGEAVEWLKEQLLKTSSENTEDMQRMEGERLAMMIRRFQIAQGLVPDGIAGVQTIIRLNSLLEPDIPRLRGSEERSELESLPLRYSTTERLN